jgi:hypothetical protein
MPGCQQQGVTFLIRATDLGDRDRAPHRIGVRTLTLTLFTLSTFKVLRLDVILEVGDGENHSDADLVLVRTRGRQC